MNLKKTIKICYNRAIMDFHLVGIVLTDLRFIYYNIEMLSFLHFPAKIEVHVKKKEKIGVFIACASFVTRLENSAEFYQRCKFGSESWQADQNHKEMNNSNKVLQNT